MELVGSFRGRNEGQRADLIVVAVVGECFSGIDFLHSLSCRVSDSS